MKKLIYIITCISILTASCELNQKDINPTDEFVKVYNHPEEGEAYFATSILQVSDGYLILTGLKENGLFNVYPKAVVIKTNLQGEITNTYQSNWVAPTPKLVNLPGQIGFVAMDNQFGGHFIMVDPSTGTETGSTPLAEILRPLSANIVNDQLVVLGYNLSSQSIVSLYNSSLSHQNTSLLGSGNDYVTEIDHHLMKTGYEFPFFIGDYTTDSESGFFVNCFSNASLSINFFNNGGSRTGGYIYEHQALFSAPSSLVHREGSSFALTRYTSGKNFINPSIDVDFSVPQRYSDSIQNPLFEVPEKTKFISRKITINGSEHLIFTTVSNANSILIYRYNMDSDELVNKHSIPFTNNTEVVDVIQDETDEGIVILARTYVTGKYIRPLVVKVAKDKL